MYVNKARKTIRHWWEAYLLFKCSIVVLPLYSALILIGLYCIKLDIEVTAPLKSIYQFVILIFSAAVIFIFVLLLATFNGDNRAPPEGSGPSIDQFEIDLDSISLPRRRSLRTNRGERTANQTSISSSIWAAIFGNYHEDEEFDEFDDDEYNLDPEEMQMTLAAVEAEQHEAARQHGSTISTFDDLPPLMMNQAQGRLVSSLERATDDLEYFFSQINSFELSPEDHSVTPPRLAVNLLPSNKLFQQPQNLLPPGYHHPSTSSTSVPFDYSNVQAGPSSSFQISILPSVGAPPPTFGGHLAPPMPPQYCSTNTLNHPSTSVAVTRLSEPSFSGSSTTAPVNANTSTFITAEFPPSYEEATRASL